MSKENCTPESLEKQLADYKKSTALFAAKYRNADFLAKRLLGAYVVTLIVGMFAGLFLGISILDRLQELEQIQVIYATTPECLLPTTGAAE